MLLEEDSQGGEQTDDEKHFSDVEPVITYQCPSLSYCHSTFVKLLANNLF